MDKKKILLVVDAQNDFVEGGSLAVKGAQNAMENLAQYICEHDNEYAFKVFTADWHPMTHMSFVDQNGQWPAHCVQHTSGASIVPCLVSAMWKTKKHVLILTKGTDETKEEYSIFENETSAKELSSLIEKENIEQVDICGIAGDICVLSTLKQGVEKYGKGMFNVLEEFCPSLDGGKALHDYIEQELKL